MAVGPVSVTLFPKGLFAGGSKYGIAMFEHVVEDASPYRAPNFEVIANRLTGDQQPGDLGYVLKEADPSANDLDRPLVVGVVRPGGPAEAAGLKVGVTIVAVDGHDVRGDQTSRYDPLTQVAAGAVVELGLEGGETVSITAAKMQ